MNFHVREEIRQASLLDTHFVWQVTMGLELRSANLAGHRKVNDPNSAIILENGALTSHQFRIRSLLELLVLKASDEGWRSRARWSDHPDLLEEDWIVSSRRLSSYGMGEDVVVLSARKIDRDIPLSADDVSDLFGLTQAEAKLAVLIASGFSVKQCAERNGVNVSTVRTQLRSIFTKVDCRKQAELVSLIWRAAAA